MGTELGPQQELLEDVAEANWLLCMIWQSVEGVKIQTRRMAAEVERAEVRRELEELREEAKGLRNKSSKDSESSGSWRMGTEETEERESERWRSTMNPELEELGSLEGLELEVEKEMDKEIVDEDMTLQ